ncbi:hypothetical protein JCM1840_000778 [Sporobolomyces johnsonii]
MFRRKSRQGLSSSSPTDPAPPPPPPQPTHPPLALTSGFTVPFAPESSPSVYPSEGYGYRGPELLRQKSGGREKVHQPAQGGFHKPLAYRPEPGSRPTGSTPSRISRSPSEPAWAAYPPSSSSRLPQQPPPPTSPPPPPPRSSDHSISRRSIASFYPSPTSNLSLGLPKSTSLPSLLSPTPSFAPSTQRSRSFRKSKKQPPTYNILLAGARGTGKSGFVRALSESVQLAKGATIEKGKVQLAGGLEAETTSLDVMEAGERVALTLLDSPGLAIPMGSGRGGSSSLSSEIGTERQVDEIIRLLEARFRATLLGEAQVVREPGGSGHDSHVHLCIYFVHPQSFTRKPAAATSRNGDQNGGRDGSAGRGGAERMMSDLDLRCIARLSTRVNVLPVLALADSLTIPTLNRFKRTVASSLSTLASSSSSVSFLSSLDTFFGAAGSPSSASPTTLAPPPFSNQQQRSPRTDSASDGHPSGTSEGARSALPVPPPEPEARVIRTRSLSRSRKRRSRARSFSATTSRSGEEEDEFGEDSDEREEQKREEAEQELRSRWPFALVSPDYDELEEDQDNEGERRTGTGKKQLLREFRHGTLDVLNPDHCDFAPLRNALFGERMNRLKSLTRLHFFEPYRTERLLAARRATGNPADALKPPPVEVERIVNQVRAL